MPSLYGSSGGANRKLRELYARDSGGATRKLRELWGRDAGGVGRKVFSALEAKCVSFQMIGDRPWYVKNIMYNTALDVTFNTELESIGYDGTQSHFYFDGDNQKLLCNLKFDLSDSTQYDPQNVRLQLTTPINPSGNISWNTIQASFNFITVDNNQTNTINTQKYKGSLSPSILPLSIYGSDSTAMVDKITAQIQHTFSSLDIYITGKEQQTYELFFHVVVPDSAFVIFPNGIDECPINFT